jgi:hypothetical protein
MKQATIDRIKYLLETDSEDLVEEPGDMKLLRKMEKRLFELITEKMLATPGKTTFAQHGTIQ